MEKISVRTKVSEDQSVCSIDLKIEGMHLGEILLDAAELERLIHKLASARARLAERVPPSLDPGSRLVATPNPAWLVPDPPWENQRLLAIRDPGLGWLGYLFSLATAKEIGDRLVHSAIKPEQQNCAVSKRVHSTPATLRRTSTGRIPLVLDPEHVEK